MIEYKQLSEVGPRADYALKYCFSFFYFPEAFTFLKDKSHEMWSLIFSEN